LRECVEQSKLTGMIVTDLRKEIAEQYKEIDSLKKANEELRAKNKELTDMLEIATRELREIKGTKKDEGEVGVV
jgi:cell division protein FtsB